MRGEVKSISAGVGYGRIPRGITTKLYYWNKSSSLVKMNTDNMGLTNVYMITYKHLKAKQYHLKANKYKE